jgi:protein-S-isoprenylcysteine O-methyltransferase Ste14
VYPPGSPDSEGNVMTLTGWGALLGLLVVAAIVVAAIVLIIRFAIRHRRGYD